MKKIAVTGASGFIGRALVGKLLNRGYLVKAIIRSRNFHLTSPNLEIVRVDDLNAHANLSELFKATDTVIHCASPGHSPERAKANIRKIAESAALAGADKFIFLSSIKVNGQRTLPGEKYSALHEPKPEDSYGLSKLMAERELWLVSKRLGLSVVVVRPPLVYGPEVKGNMRRLMDWIASGVPLPVGSIRNKRSMIGIDNLTALLVTCCECDRAVGRTLLVSDGEDLSTSEIVAIIAKAMNVPVRIIPCPQILIRMVGYLTGKPEFTRLLDSLQIDSSETNKTLEFAPFFSVKRELRSMAQWYIREK